MSKKRRLAPQPTPEPDWREFVRLTPDEALVKCPEAAESWPTATATYAKAVEVAQFLGLPLSCICVFHLGWAWMAIPGFSLQGWHYSRPRWSWDRKAVEYFVFRFNNRDEAKEAGLAFGKELHCTGEIRPYEESPEGIAAAAREAEAAWALLEEQTRPTPIHELSGAARKQAVRWLQLRQAKGT